MVAMMVNGCHDDVTNLATPSDIYVVICHEPQFTLGQAKQNCGEGGRHIVNIGTTNIERKTSSGIKGVSLNILSLYSQIRSTPTEKYIREEGNIALRKSLLIYQNSRNYKFKALRPERYHLVARRIPKEVEPKQRSFF